MARKPISPPITNILRRYKQRLSQQHVSVDKLILFGSHAKGTAKPYSDIDVAVVSPQLGKDSVDEYVKLSMLSKDIDLRIEPHPYHPKDLQDKWDSLAAEIRRTGVPV